MKNKIFLALFFCTTFYCANAQYTKLLDFAGITNGNNPQGSLISDGNFLYGMTVSGGTNNEGTIFKIMSDGTAYSKLLDFSFYASGMNPYGSLFFDGIFLYGMTNKGGLNGMGVIFKIKPDGSSFSKLFDFSDTVDGSNPYVSLISDGTFLYGMTNKGGTNNLGVLFKIMPDGTGDTVLLNFNGGVNGSYPTGDLFYDGTFLYGMTSQGGAYNRGTMFKILTDGTGYFKLIDFGSGVNGKYPLGNLNSDGTFLYGMTSQGGPANLGTIFKIMGDSTGYSILQDFSGFANGNHPRGSLISDGSFLFGMTTGGGINGNGIIFELMSDGSGYSKLMDFSGNSNAPNSFASLISDGTFLYGMTPDDGLNDMGTVFKFDFTTGMTENIPQNIFSLSPNPSNGIFTLNSKITNGEISICNLLGETIFSEWIPSGQSTIKNQTSTIDLSNEANGIYFVNVKTDKDTFTQKIIIDK